MWLSGISSHAAGLLLTQWGRTVKSPWVCTVTSWYPFCYDLTGCKFPTTNYICIFLYVSCHKRSTMNNIARINVHEELFWKYAVSAIPENDVSNVNSKFVDWVLEKSYSDMGKLRVYLYIYEELFLITRFLTLALTFEPHLFGMALNAFWKRTIYIHHTQSRDLNRIVGGKTKKITSYVQTPLRKSIFP